jgi:hypothetical protein
MEGIELARSEGAGAYSGQPRWVAPRADATGRGNPPTSSICFFSAVLRRWMDTRVKPACDAEGAQALCARVVPAVYGVVAGLDLTGLDPVTIQRSSEKLSDLAETQIDRRVGKAIGSRECAPRWRAHQNVSTRCVLSSAGGHAASAPLGARAPLPTLQLRLNGLAVEPRIIALRVCLFWEAVGDHRVRQSSNSEDSSHLPTRLARI